jgi:hypothetical protein
MIEYALLVMLGFCAAGLLALLIAPTIWNRAVRLTTKRLDATLPMSLSEIEADKDLLRASYAVQIRRLEAGLNKARDKSASQLVEISRLQMTIGEMRDHVQALERQLEERRNAANVFERTITRRFPEMETALAAAKSALDERAYEIADLNNKLRRKDEALVLAQRSVSMQQAEIRKLRETLEQTSADRTGRFKKRPAQWTLEEFRSEYDRLNLELSKMREQLALGHERETSQIAVLKAELQNLAEQIMASVMAQEKQAAAHRTAEAPQPSPNRDPGMRPRKRGPDRPLNAPQPWPAVKPGAPQTVATRPAPAQPAPRPDAPASPQPAQGPATALPRETTGRSEAGDGPPKPAEARRSAFVDDAASVSKSDGSAALKTLLDRAAAVVQKDKLGGPSPAADAARRPAATSAEIAPAMELEPKPKPDTHGAEALAGPGAAAKPASPEPNLDRMLREIFETRGGAPATAGADDAKPAAAGSPSEEPAAKPAGEPARTAEAGDGDAEAEKTPIDRIRMI